MYYGHDRDFGKSSNVVPVVAMIHVPPEQVPNGIMNLIRSYYSMLHHVRVVISFNTKSTVEESLAVDESSHSYSSLLTEHSYTVLIAVKTMDDAIQMVQNLHERPFTSLQMNVRAKVYHVTRLEDENHVEIQFDTHFASMDSSGTSMLNPCAVCLESLSNTTMRSSSPSFHGYRTNQSDTRHVIFTTACTHSFHLDCFVKCQNAPCPLCRFDHSTLNDSLSSSCHACGSCHQIYICLVCGIVSCQAEDTLTEVNIDPTSTWNHTLLQQQHHHSNHPSLDQDSNVSGHARMHYQQTLHAYALEVESQHVFDFAGNGYVHRLIQNKEDGKLVEVSDPHYALHERSRTPGLSDEQQEEVMHIKLERLAYRYQNMLRNFMDQQRHYYQDIIYDLKRQLDESKSVMISKERNCSSTLKKNVHQILSALKQEKHQLLQRHESLKKKYVKLMEDLRFMEDFNKSLETNQESLRRQITHTQQERRDIDDVLRSRLPPLQQRLTQLMSQLESTLEVKD